MSAGSSVLEVDSLSCRFGGVTALDSVSLRLRPGETRCVIGPNGAGKTTLLNAITGLVKVQHGVVRYEGATLARRSPARLARAGIVRSFQTPQVFGELSVAENYAIAVGRTPQGDVDALFADLGLGALAATSAARLSQGERKRLELGMILARSPKVLLLDEPTAGMSGAETREIAELIKLHAAGIATMIIEHDMAFVRDIADSVSVLHRGALLMEGSLEQVQADERVRDIYLGSEVM